MLIRTNMEDMREKTHMRHYELYRKKRLEQVWLQLSMPYLLLVQYEIGFSYQCKPFLNVPDGLHGCRFR